MADPYLPIAKSAKIPAAKIRWFLSSVNRAVMLFEGAYDDDRRKLKAATHKVKIGTSALLRALEYLDGHQGGSAMLDRFLRVEQMHHGDRVMPEGALGECRVQIELLGKAAASIEELPKGVRNRTRRLIAAIWELAEQCGGKLSYDKNANTGTMADVIAFLRERMPPRFWKNLSPSTIERLRPKR